MVSVSPQQFWLAVRTTSKFIIVLTARSPAGCDPCAAQQLRFSAALQLC
jgi:hypothetical protein